MSDEKNSTSIGFFFEPANIAIMGVSRNPDKLGNITLKNLLKLKFKGNIFPVNPYASEIMGLKTFSSLFHIPGDIDIVLICLPAIKVLLALEDCEKRGVKGVVIGTAGFGELGGEGKDRQQKIKEIVKRSTIRIIGPNTTGILNPYDHFTTSFADLPDVKKGAVAFVAQTGMFAGISLQWILTAQHFGLSKVAGLGNKIDVNDTEVLKYLLDDPFTKVIMMYVEALDDGADFFKTAREVTRIKPIIVLKTGKTVGGARAAISHTGSISGDNDIFNGLARQAGIIQVDDFEEMFNLAKTFAYQPVPRKNKIGVISFAGSIAVLIMDLLEKTGLEIAALESSTIMKLEEKMPYWARAGHPVDTGPLYEMGIVESALFSFEALLADPQVHGCILAIGGINQMNPEILSQKIHNLTQKHPEKPVVVYAIGEKDSFDRLFKLLEERHVPVFSNIADGVRSLAALYHYGRYLNSMGE